MTATTISKSASFRPDIQGMRAIAVVLVVVFHAGIALSGGYVGVDVFFVLSGYVITQMLQRERTETGRIRLGTFYLRRIRRLLPALCTVLVVVFALLPVLGPPATSQLGRRTGMAGALFVSNIHLARIGEGDYFSPDAGANPFLHLWSLSVEEQFYLGFPFLMLVAGLIAVRLSRGTWVTMAVVGGAAAASFALNLWLMSGLTRYGTQVSYFMSPTRAWEFLAGALAALWAWQPDRRSAEILGWIGLALVAWASITFDEATSFPGTAALVPVMGTMFLLLGGRNQATRLTRALSLRPALWLGDRSYAWYLWHWPLIVFASSVLPGQRWLVVGAAVASLALAALSFMRVETPIRQRRSVSTTRTLALGALCVTLPLAAGVGAKLGEGAWPSKVDQYLGEFNGHADVEQGCDSSSGGERPPEDCTWTVPQPTGLVVLVGDSNAGHLSEGLLDAAQGLSLDATVLTRSNCAFLDLPLPKVPGETDNGCRDRFASVMRWIEKTRPEVVVMSGVLDTRLRAGHFLVDPSTGRLLYDREDKAHLWESALTDVLHHLDSLGIATVVVTSIPRFLSWQDPRLCSPLTVMVDQARCGAQVNREAASQGPMAVAIATENRAVAAVPTAQALDLWPVLCPGTKCRTYRDGRWWFKDRTHITVHASHQVAGLLKEAIQQALAAA